MKLLLARIKLHFHCLFRFHRYGRMSVGGEIIWLFCETCDELYYPDPIEKEKDK